MRVFGIHRALYRGERSSYRFASPAAAARARAVTLVEELRARGLSVNDACYRSGVAVSTYYRWRARVRLHGVKGLERRVSTSRRSRVAPKQRLIAEHVENLRAEYPWGKAKLVVLLTQQGFDVSESTVGRVLGKLLARGAILPCGVTSNRVRIRQQTKRMHARRKRHGEMPTHAGELIQIDTLHENRDGVPRRHFTAICPISRFVIADVHRSATSSTARDFLERVLERAPFPVRSIQVDNGSEFKGAFEARCADLGIELVTIKPHTPKMNAIVERMQRTFRDEFYAQHPPTDRLDAIRDRLERYVRTYNEIRPHQSLNNLTPTQYLEPRNPHDSQNT